MFSLSFDPVTGKQENLETVLRWWQIRGTWSVLAFAPGGGVGVGGGGGGGGGGGCLVQSRIRPTRNRRDTDPTNNSMSA